VYSELLEQEDGATQQKNADMLSDTSAECTRDTTNAEVENSSDNARGTFSCDSVIHVQIEPA